MIGEPFNYFGIRPGVGRRFVRNQVFYRHGVQYLQVTFMLCTLWNLPFLEKHVLLGRKRMDFVRELSCFHGDCGNVSSKYSIFDLGRMSTL